MHLYSLGFYPHGSNFTANNIPNLTGQVYLVTGGNSGLGSETAYQLYAHGANVIITCRSIARGEEAMKLIEERYEWNIGKPKGWIKCVQMDLEDLGQCLSAANAVVGLTDRLDCIIANAGIAFEPFALSKGSGLERCFAVNFLGHFTFINSLVDLLAATTRKPLPDGTLRMARVSFVSSEAHENVNSIDYDIISKPLDKPEEQSLRAIPGMAWRYARSKLAVNLYCLSLSQKLQGHVLVNSCHPGLIGTDIGRSVHSVIGSNLDYVVRILIRNLGMSIASGSLTPLVRKEPLLGFC